MNTASADPRRGEVWWVDLDPTRGAEMQKMRPVVVVNADGLAALPLRIVVPLIGWQPQHAHRPWMVRVSPDSRNGVDKEDAADGFQVRSLSVDRFVRRIGRVSPALLADILDAVALSLDLWDQPEDDASA